MKLSEIIFLIFMALANIVSLGIFIPFLISSKDTLLVIAGFLYLLAIFCLNLFYAFNLDIYEEKEKD